MKHLWIVMAICLSTPSVYASDWYAYGGLGESRFRPTVPDGTWYQEGLGARWTTESFAWKVGMGYRMTPEWAVEGGWVSMGAVQQHGWAVSDENYDPGTKRANGKQQPVEFNAKDRVQGIEVAVVRSWSFWDGWVQPFGRVGGWTGWHRVTFEARHQDGSFANDGGFTGVLGGVTGGGGVCVQWVCAETQVYRALWEAHYPIAKWNVMPMLTVKVPF